MTAEHSISAPPALCCPACREELGATQGALECVRCGRWFPIVGGVPSIVLAETEGAALGQAAWFDNETNPDFEATRPHSTPALYQWYYLEKFRRGVSMLPLAGSTALTVCGGSGMDAEFLARRGAHVISSDLSLRANQRALARARRLGLAIQPVMADAGRLPFADQAIDIVYVHDGLHHLERPMEALREMARVARVGISVNEPARAAVTALAVRLGFALEFEDAGNRVGRLRAGEVVTELERAGFSIATVERYGMYFKHEPGRVVATLSRRRVLRAVQLAIGAFNATAGRYGNKLAVQAVRPGRLPLAARGRAMSASVNEQVLEEHAPPRGVTATITPVLTGCDVPMTRKRVGPNIDMHPEVKAR